MDLPDNVELIFIDDGSDPPLPYPYGLKNCRMIVTGDRRPWTVELARNAGARLARGDYYLMTDLDYIITWEAIDLSLTVQEDKMCFRREFGVIDEAGLITQDLDVLRSYGLLQDRIEKRGTRLSPHPNNFVMRRETFWALGGYREDLVERTYPNKGDTYFKRRWAESYAKGNVTLAPYRATLYMFPNGQFCGDVDYNPFGLFHDLTRKTERNYWYARVPG